jgi:hypothetical protein
VLVVECGESHLEERRYIYGVLLGDFLGLEFELESRPRQDGDIVIRSADAGDARELRIADLLFAGHELLLSPDVLPRGPLVRCRRSSFGDARLLDDVPALYSRLLAFGEQVSVQAESVELGLDIFGGAFVMLTRLDETVLDESDEHGRFPAAAMLAVREGYAGRPLVDEYTEILWWALSLLWPGLERPADAFTVRPTHDVDWPFYSRGRVVESIVDAATDSVVRRDRSLALARMRALVAVRRRGRDADPCNTFGFLMDESERRSLQGSFYFMAGRTNRARDPGYSLDDGWLRGLMREIDRRGHEIGLHPSYGTFRDVVALQAERGRLERALAAERIEQHVVGGRQHFLRWSPASWVDWETAGLSYDSSAGFASICGFRCGTCRDFTVFDVATRRRLALQERPLVAMETALLNYQESPVAAAAEELRRLKDACRLVGGPFTFLWHNNRLTTRPEREAYASVLG